MLKLAHGLAFEDLYRRAGLLRLDRHFLDFLAAAEPPLADRVAAARAAPGALAAKDESHHGVSLVDRAKARRLVGYARRLIEFAAEVLAR